MGFDATFGSPLGVVVNEDVVFHRQFEVGDLLTHPPREKHTHKINSRSDSHLRELGVSVTYRMVSMISLAASWCLSWEQKEVQQ